MELLPYMQVNDLLELRREPDNEHDKFAIALLWRQEKIGYLPAGINEMTARLIDANALPLLGMITHLNKEVKPWESVSAAKYILRDKNTDIPVYAPYLTKPDEPVYSTLANRKEEDLYDEIFENTNRTVVVDTISNPESVHILKNIIRRRNIGLCIKISRMPMFTPTISIPLCTK